MGRKRTKTSIKKACDKLWSQIVRTRDPYCVKCGKPTENAHHIFGRRAMSTRWDTLNGLGLCTWDHTFSPQGFEQSPVSSANIKIIKDKIGDDGYEDLDRRHNKIKKWTLEGLLDLEQELKEELEAS